MSDRWKVEVSHDACWLVTPRALASADLPRGRLLPPDHAVARLDEWLPDGPDELVDIGPWADICLDIGELSSIDGPFTVARVKEALAAALWSGHLTAIRIRATTEAHRRVEAELEDERKPPEQTTHVIDVDVYDQKRNKVAGLEYAVIGAGGPVVQGVLDGNHVHKSGVKKGTYVLHVHTLHSARWGSNEVRIGAEVELLAAVTSYPEGHAGTFEIADAADPGTVLVTRNGAVRPDLTTFAATWTPQPGELQQVKSGRLVAVAKIDALAATSAPVVVKREVEIQVKTPAGPVADNTAVTVRFSGGARETVPTQGGSVRVWVPLGETLSHAAVGGFARMRARLRDEAGMDSKLTVAGNTP